MAFKEKPEILKFNTYLAQGDIKRDEYCALLHEAFPLMSVEDKERVFVDTFKRFPETLDYAMLKMSTIISNVKEKYWDEYKGTYRDFLEDVETDLLIAFGDIDIFLTYSRLYVVNMSICAEELSEHILKNFKERHYEREKARWEVKRIS